MMMPRPPANGAKAMESTVGLIVIIIVIMREAAAAVVVKVKATIGVHIRRAHDDIEVTLDRRNEVAPGKRIIIIGKFNYYYYKSTEIDGMV
jgi:predicted metal-dependent TIM-barrel fold hydrolase